MMTDINVLSSKDWLKFGPEQRRAVQGLLDAIGAAEPLIASEMLKMPGGRSRSALQGILSWIDLCRDLDVLPKKPI